MGHIKFDKLWINLGYCSKKTVKKFISKNKIMINNSALPSQFKMRTLVDPQRVSLNGKPIPYLDFNLHVLINKATGVSCYPIHDYGDGNNNGKEVFASTEDNDEEYQQYFEYDHRGEEEEGIEYGDEEDSEISIFDILPETFLYRKPVFNIATPLPVEIGGLTFLTQDYELTKCFSSIRNPLGRTYEVQLRDDFTGLEQDALRTLRGEVKPSVKKVINAPKFTVVNESERIAHVTLHDYKPDNILETLLSIRHEPVSVKRIAIGHLQLANKYMNSGEESETEDRIVVDLKENEWRVLNDDTVNYMLLDKKIQNDRRRILIQRAREAKEREEAKNPKPKVMSYEERAQIESKEITESMHSLLFSDPLDELEVKQNLQESDPEHVMKRNKLERMDPEERAEYMEKALEEEARMFEEISKKYEKKTEEKKPSFKPITPRAPHSDLDKIFRDEELDTNKLGKL